MMMEKMYLCTRCGGAVRYGGATNLLEYGIWMDIKFWWDLIILWLYCFMLNELLLNVLLIKKIIIAQYRLLLCVGHYHCLYTYLHTSFAFTSGSRYLGQSFASHSPAISQLQWDELRFMPSYKMIESLLGFAAKRGALSLRKRVFHSWSLFLNGNQTRIKKIFEIPNLIR